MAMSRPLSGCRAWCPGTDPGNYPRCSAEKIDDNHAVARGEAGHSQTAFVACGQTAVRRFPIETETKTTLGLQADHHRVVADSAAPAARVEVGLLGRSSQVDVKGTPPMAIASNKTPAARLSILIAWLLAVEYRDYRDNRRRSREETMIIAGVCLDIAVDRKAAAEGRRRLKRTMRPRPLEESDMKMILLVLIAVWPLPEAGAQSSVASSNEHLLRIVRHEVRPSKARLQGLSR